MKKRYEFHCEGQFTYTLVFDKRGHWVVEVGPPNATQRVPLETFSKTDWGQRLSVELTEAIEKAQNDV